LIKGPLHGVLHISIDQSKGVEDLKKEIGNAIKKLDKGRGVIILTDLFGGTPSNISLSFLKEGKVEVVTGVNLPMILKLSDVKEGMSLKDFACMIKEYGKKNISLASEILSKKAAG
jgi:PTS system mannose-specific IIA component